MLKLSTFYVLPESCLLRTRRDHLVFRNVSWVFALAAWEAGKVGGSWLVFICNKTDLRCESVGRKAKAIALDVPPVADPFAG
jgi:hypothetical protein